MLPADRCVFDAIALTINVSFTTPHRYALWAHGRGDRQLLTL